MSREGWGGEGWGGEGRGGERREGGTTPSEVGHGRKCMCTREGRGGREERILQQWQGCVSSRAGKPSCTQRGHTLQPALPAALEDRAPGAVRKGKGSFYQAPWSCLLSSPNDAMISY